MIHVLLLIGAFAPGLVRFASADMVFHDSKGEEVKLEVLKPGANQKENRKVYTESFLDSYSPLAPSTLKDAFKTKEDVRVWINSTFDKEEEDFKEGKSFNVRATIKGKVVGWASVGWPGSLIAV